MSPETHLPPNAVSPMAMMGLASEASDGSQALGVISPAAIDSPGADLSLTPTAPAPTTISSPMAMMGLIEPASGEMRGMDGPASGDPAAINSPEQSRCDPVAAITSPGPLELIDGAPAAPSPKTIISAEAGPLMAPATGVDITLIASNVKTPYFKALKAKLAREAAWQKKEVAAKLVQTHELLESGWSLWSKCGTHQIVKAMFWPYFSLFWSK